MRCTLVVLGLLSIGASAAPTPRLATGWFGKDAGDDAKAAASKTGDRLQSRVSGAEERGSQRANDVGNTISQKTNEAGRVVQDKARDVKGKARDAKDRVSHEAEHISFERAVPLASAVPGAALGLQLMLNPDGAVKYIGLDTDDSSGTSARDLMPSSIVELSDSERALAVWAGAGLLIGNAAIAAVGLQGGHDMLKLANTMMLALTLVTEGAQQWVVKRRGSRPFNHGFRGTATALRTIVAGASLWALTSLMDSASKGSGSGNEF